LAATDDFLGLPVRSHEHEAAPASKPCLRHPGAGLHLPCRSHRKPAPWGTWPIPASEGRENMRSLRHRPHRPITAGRMATPELRKPVSRLGVASFRAGSHSIDHHGGRTRLHEPRGQPGGGKTCVRHRAERAKARAHARTPCRPALRTHPRDQSPSDARLQLRTTQPRRWMATGDEHRRGPRGFRYPFLFLAPAMLARMRRDAAWRLDFP
jgi:hypothetical protein